MQACGTWLPAAIPGWRNQQTTYHPTSQTPSTRLPTCAPASTSSTAFSCRLRSSLASWRSSVRTERRSSRSLRLTAGRGRGGGRQAGSWSACGMAATDGSTPHHVLWPTIHSHPPTHPPTQLDEAGVERLHLLAAVLGQRRVVRLQHLGLQAVLKHLHAARRGCGVGWL